MARRMKYALSLVVALTLAGCADSPEARLARAEKSFAANDYRLAQIDLAATLQAEPGNARALELAARSHLAQGDGVAAQGALAKLAATGRKPADFAVSASLSRRGSGTPTGPTLGSIVQNG